MKEYFVKNKLVLLVTLLLNTITAVSSVYLAKILQKVIDIAMDGDMSEFRRILVISIGYLLGLGLFGYLYSLSSKVLIRNMTRMLRQHVFSGILRRNVQDFTSVNTADYISACTNDIKLIEDNYLSPFLLVLQYAVMFIVSLIFLFDISPVIALSLIGCVILMLVIPGAMSRALQNSQNELSKQLSELTLKLKDILEGHEIIKSFQIYSHINYEFTAANNRTADAKYKADRLFALNEGISEIFAYFTQFSGLFIGAYLIIKGSVTAGTLVALIQLSGTFVSPIMMILQNIPKIKSIKPVVERIKDLADYKDTSATGTLTPSFTKYIKITNLSFAYESNHPVLQNNSITLYKSKKYAIVGKSGCGKSTLVKLLTGDYLEYDGEIEYDGVSLHEIDNEHLHKMSAVIHQNIYMFDSTIKDNICLYNEFSESELSKALDLSGVSQFIQKMPAGLMTCVGENGSNLSGGQRQRIAVARALVRNKPILILDEGTSAIDMQTAYDIENSLMSIDSMTLITITHNLNQELLGQYDQIIYIDDGMIAETGSLKELLDKNGGFARFINIDRS